MSCTLFETMQKLEEKGQALFECTVPQVVVPLKQMQLRPAVVLTSLLVTSKLNANAESHSSVLRRSSGTGVEKGFVALLVVTRITIVSIAEHLLFILNCKTLL